MSDPISFGELDFKLVSSMDRVASKLNDDTPFRMAVLGDFSGRVNRGIHKKGKAELNFQLVDRDNLENLMARMDIRLDLDIADDATSKISININELDDFHPDNLFQQLKVFKELKEKRKLLKDPKTFAKTAADLKTPEEAGKSAPENNPGQPEIISDSDSLLDQIIDSHENGSASAEKSAPKSEWGRFLQKIVAPHIVAGDDAKQEKMIAAVDASVTSLMNRLLHHPDFQALEAAWRALKFLVNRLETDTHLAVYMCDISKEELAADLTTNDDLCTTALFKKLVAESIETPGAAPWSLIVGNYTFTPSGENARFLGRMSKIAHVAGAPFIAAGHSSAFGCEALELTPDPADRQLKSETEDESVWKELQLLPESNYIGLLLPRFLLRYPYGEKTEPTDYFDFEEIDDNFEHNHYLWGNPAFACACLIGRTFTQYGRHFDQGPLQDIHNLPLHTYIKDGETINKPCAEVLLTQRAVEKIMENGLMVLISFQNQDHIRIPRFQAISAPPTLLAGRFRN